MKKDEIERFKKSVLAVQSKLSNEIVALLSGLATDAGAILPTLENFALVAAIEERMWQLMNRAGYGKALADFTKALDANKVALDAVFARIVPNFNAATNVGNVVFQVTRREAIKTMSIGAVQEQASQFSTIMNEAISTSSNYRGLVNSIRDNIAGTDEFKGRLESYAGTYARDSFSISERSYATAVANEYGVDWFIYLGGEIEDTREFCLERDGLIFHRTEIEAWADLDWQGKNRATTESTIFNLCGGYNCIHTLVPVSVEDVPEDKRKEFE